MDNLVAQYLKFMRCLNNRVPVLIHFHRADLIHMKDEDKSKKQLIDELKELREFKSIFENLPIGIAFLDADFRFIAANRFVTEFTGLSEQELVGKLCYDKVGEYADDPSKEGTEKVCSFCKKDECFSSRRPTITERPLGDSILRVTTIPKLDEKGDISRFLEIIEDITESRKAEAETIRVSQLAALGELAAGVAHEINNPINGIINYAELLSGKTGQEDKRQEITRRIIKEGDRIAGIVKNLLSFSAVSRHEPVVVSVNEIMSDSLALTETQIRKDGIHLTVNIPEDLPQITAQSQQIEQVFLNVISNARYALNQKYPETHDNKILEIYAEQMSVDDKPYVQVTFHDRGTGIPDKILDKIKNPFFSTKPNGVGTGLGLSISHSIVSNHGGRLLIDSAEGEYTKILIQLPSL